MKFYVPKKNRFNGVHYQTKKLGICVETGRKSHHTKASKKEIDALEFRTVEFDVTKKDVFRQKRTKKHDDYQGQVSEDTLTAMIGKDKSKQIFDSLEKDSIKYGDFILTYKVYVSNGKRVMFAENFFTKKKVTDVLWDLGYRGAFWDYLGRDEGLNMKIYIPF